jgi:hypothetical protein
MTARDRFNGIKPDYWDCEGSEVLTHLDPISALEAIVENHAAPFRGDEQRPIEDVIREMGTITVSAYRRSVITEEMIRDGADVALDALVEHLEEQDLSDDSGDHPLFSVDVLAQHRAAFQDVIRDLAMRAKIWRCEVSQTVELSPDEALEILRVERPEWFAPSPQTEPPFTSPEAELVGGA